MKKLIKKPIKRLVKSKAGRKINFDRKAIQTLRREGYKLKDIAKILGCSIQTASISSRL